MESLVVLLVTLSIQHRARALGAISFGVAVHLKIYPIIYAMPLLWSLGPRTLWPWRWVRAQWCFGLISAGAFFAVSYAAYFFYEEEFLEHAYLYHVSRRDHRHNFSIYAYWIYLGRESASLAGPLASAVQLSAVGVVGWRYAHEDLALGLFLQTLVFVAFNKVVTAQYFMWSPRSFSAGYREGPPVTASTFGCSLPFPLPSSSFPVFEL